MIQTQNLICNPEIVNIVQRVALITCSSTIKIVQIWILYPIKFSLLHLNIRSISKKLDSFSNFLGSLSVKFSDINITETWHNDSSHTSDISGYNFIHRHRVDRSGGGVGIYHLDYLDFKHCADLAFRSDCAESLFIEINRTKEKNILIGVIYRPPDKNLPQFIIELDQLVDRIWRENKPVFFFRWMECEPDVTLTPLSHDGIFRAVLLQNIFSLRKENRTG